QNVLCDLTGKVATAINSYKNFLVRIQPDVTSEVFTFHNCGAFGLRRDMPGTHCEGMMIQGTPQFTGQINIEYCHLESLDSDGKTPAYAFLWEHGSAAGINIANSSSTVKWSFAPGWKDAIRDIFVDNVEG